MPHRNHLVAVLLLAFSTAAFARQSGAGVSSGGLLQAALTTPGSPPFHLKATITDRDQQGSGEVEIHWVNPTKWRRTISSAEFSQTLVVNGTQVFEQDSDDYIPLGLQTLLIAMTDPQPLIDSLRPGDPLATKANGGTKPPEICSHLNLSRTTGGQMMCHQGPYKDSETIGPAGHKVSFAEYQDFKGRKVARLLLGTTEAARVTELTELKKPDDAMFAIQSPTPKERQIRVVTLPEDELRGQAPQPLEIIWPQVLDGATTGTSSYYLSIDRKGNIRETLTVVSASERANESAIRQIEKWKFRPVVEDGLPVQAEGIVTFKVDTRAWGPAEPLTDAEVRKLASNVVEPIFPIGTASGATCTMRVAIDSDGELIEAIAGEGTPGLFIPYYHAIKMWQFHPIMENGKPRPYRGELKFQAP